MAEGGRLIIPEPSFTNPYRRRKRPRYGFVAEGVIPSSNNYNELKLQYKAYRYLKLYHTYIHFLFII